VDLDPPVASTRPADGRYLGGNPQLHADLRIDTALSGVVSADLFRLGPGGKSYVASIRTPPGVLIDGDGKEEWAIVGQDELGGRSAGQIKLEARPNHVLATVVLERALHGLPAGTEIVLVVERQGNALRQLGVELEREAQVAAPPSYNFNGRAVTFESCFEDAGIELTEVGHKSQIPANADAWGTAQLHTLMRDFAQASLSRRAWEVHLLWLAKSTRPGLLGVMFDSTENLPRQGAAIFAEEIQRLTSVATERKLVQTTVHELGHALNLAHRFERTVGRADSTSFMNYDWRYRGGNQRQEFWSRFDFTFDSDELEFLRHGPLPAVIPGGTAFHAVNYWADGGGGYSPYVPEEPLPGFSLRLTPPAAGAVFDFAQPVFLQVEFQNQTGSPLDLSPQILDPKGGLLEILIRRRTGAPTAS